MPIAIRCTGCRQRLRLPDKAAGKRVKCPKCQAVLTVPKEQTKPGDEGKRPPADEEAAQQTLTRRPQDETGSPLQTAAGTEAPAAREQPAAAPEGRRSAQTVHPSETDPAQQTPDRKSSLPDRWYLKAEDGEDYGPVSRAELDQWRDEGRITADCHVLQDGADQWQWASDIYPELEIDEEAPAAGPPPAGEVAVPAPVQPDKPAVDPNAFQFAAADASPSLRARGRKRVRKKKKTTKKAAPTTPGVPATNPVAGPTGTDEVSTKSKMVAGLLGIFLGAYGVHRFYLGYTGLGLVMLCTCGGCGIWALVDAILIFMGKVPDAEGRPLRDS
jgi:LSD1 subclass zinc finger protein